MKSGIDEHAGVVERAPQQRRLPVIAHEHGHDRRDDRLPAPVLAQAGSVSLGARRKRLGGDDGKAELVQAVAQPARVLEHAPEQRGTVRRSQHAQGGQRGTDRGGDGGGGEQEGARGDA